MVINHGTSQLFRLTLKNSFLPFPDHAVLKALTSMMEEIQITPFAELGHVFLLQYRH